MDDCPRVYTIEPWQQVGRHIIISPSLVTNLIMIYGKRLLPCFASFLLTAASEEERLERGGRGIGGTLSWWESQKAEHHYNSGKQISRSAKPFHQPKNDKGGQIAGVKARKAWSSHPPRSPQSSKEENKAKGGAPPPKKTQGSKRKRLKQKPAQSPPPHSKSHLRKEGGKRWRKRSSNLQKFMQSHGFYSLAHKRAWFGMNTVEALVEDSTCWDTHVG